MHAASIGDESQNFAAQGMAKAHFGLQPKLREVELPRLQRRAKHVQLRAELRADHQRLQRLLRAVLLRLHTVCAVRTRQMQVFSAQMGCWDSMTFKGYSKGAFFGLTRQLQQM